MKPTVYIETTIVSYLTAWPSRDVVRLSQQILTRKWWDESRPRFDIYTSDIVVNEAARGDPQAAADRIAALADLALVPIPASAAPLAETLLTRSALPSKARVDAVHLAIAATNALQ